MQNDTYIQNTNGSTLAGSYIEIGHMENQSACNYLKAAAMFTVLAGVLPSVMTYATPIILSENTTMIQESFSDQLVDATRISPSFALSKYSIEDPVGVEYYMSKNRDLGVFLSSLIEQLNTEERIGTIALEFYRDIEEGWEKLFVVASTNLDDVDELIDLEDSLFDELFIPDNALVRGRVVLSLV